MLVLLVLTNISGTRTIPTAQAGSEGYKAETVQWRAAMAGFRSWNLVGVLQNASGYLVLDPTQDSAGTDPYPPGQYKGHNFYNGGNFFLGEATSPTYTSSFLLSQITPSWNANTPPGTWIEVHMRARIVDRWTRWYNLGVWASDTSTIERHSVDQQSDADGTVATDTLILGTSGASGDQGSANAFQMKVRLFSVSRNISPEVRNASATFSTTPQSTNELLPGDKSRWNDQISIPECSQMVYPDGGEVWCSPTSLSMVLAYWKEDSGPCAPVVRSTVSGVYDWVYQGDGNWPFNAAYAATQGLEAYVVRFTSLAQTEAWIAAGVPVIVSLGWQKGELTGAPVTSSDGHLVVLAGFSAAGDPIINDPAAPTNESVRRVYQRAQFERLWLEYSGGTAYLVYPQDWPIPQIASTPRRLPHPDCRRYACLE
jgi:hypothetical protein